MADIFGTLFNGTHPETLYFNLTDIVPLYLRCHMHFVVVIFRNFFFLMVNWTNDHNICECYIYRERSIEILPFQKSFFDMWYSTNRHQFYKKGNNTWVEFLSKFKTWRTIRCPNVLKYLINNLSFLYIFVICLDRQYQIKLYFSAKCISYLKVISFLAITYNHLYVHLMFRIQQESR